MNLELQKNAKFHEEKKTFFSANRSDLDVERSVDRQSDDRSRNSVDRNKKLKKLFEKHI